MKISDVGLLKTVPNLPQNSKNENSVYARTCAKTYPVMLLVITTDRMNQEGRQHA